MASHATLDTRRTDHRNGIPTDSRESDFGRLPAPPTALPKVPVDMKNPAPQPPPVARPPTTHTPWRLGVAIGLCAWLAAAPNAAADSIQELYEAAKANDPILGGVYASYQSRKTQVTLARSQLLPSLELNGSKNESRQEHTLAPSFGGMTVVDNSGSQRWSVDLSQTVFDADKWFSFRSAQAQGAQADHDLVNAEQDLIVRVSSAYLNVLRAQALLEAAQAEEEAVARQMEQVQQRFDVGLVAITDVLEATAAHDAAVVRRIQAEGDHDVFFETLRTLTGVAHSEVDRLDSALPIVDPEPMDESQWVEAALSSNPTVLSAREALKASERSRRATLGRLLPTVDLSVSHGSSQLDPGGLGFARESEGQTYALRFNMPLYHPAIIPGIRDLGYRVEQARQAVLEREVTVTRDTRNLFRAVATDVVRVKARIRAIKSAESALEATQTGYEVGTRNIVDVLQAQQRLFASQFDYADSRYNYVLDLLRLKQSSGTLNESDVLQLSAFSDAENPVVRVLGLSGR